MLLCQGAETARSSPPRVVHPSCHPVARPPTLRPRIGRNTHSIGYNKIGFPDEIESRLGRCQH
jgi:hypothetical protein